MPFALFCENDQLSACFATEAEVWKHAVKAGLVVDSVSEEETLSPRPVLDRGYEIKACPAGARIGHPPPEEDLGGGDIASLQEQPSTDDDKPLE